MKRMTLPSKEDNPNGITTQLNAQRNKINGVRLIDPAKNFTSNMAKINISQNIPIYDYLTINLFGITFLVTKDLYVKYISILILVIN